MTSESRSLCASPDSLGQTTSRTWWLIIIQHMSLWVLLGLWKQYMSGVLISGSFWHDGNPPDASHLILHATPHILHADEMSKDAWASSVGCNWHMHPFQSEKKEREEKKNLRLSLWWTDGEVGGCQLTRIPLEVRMSGVEMQSTGGLIMMAISCSSSTICSVPSNGH